MPKILFDGTSMQQSPEAKFHGGSEYAKFYFRKTAEQGYKFDTVFYESAEIPVEVSEIIDRYRIPYYKVKSKKELYALISKEHYHRFYSALPYDYSDYNLDTPLYGVIHGLRKAELPYDMLMARMEYKTLKKLAFGAAALCKPIANAFKKRQLKKAKALLQIPNANFITVSETTKASLIFNFPWLAERNIIVAYSPFERFEQAKVETGEKYFLMVSANRFEKNVPMAIKAFDCLFSKGLLDGYKVKVTGCDENAFYTKVKNSDRFDFLPYVSKEELETLYTNAYCLVYPSINEGFGYPPLHAMLCGVPVIASSATSIPEACGDGAMFFSPYSEYDLCNRLIQVTTEPKIYNELKTNGLSHAEEFLSILDKQVNEIIKLIFGK